VAGPQVVLSDPGVVVDPPVDHVRLTFNHPLDPDTFTTTQASLSGPAGDIALTAVTAVPSTNNQQFDLSFASQVQPGDYALLVSAAVLDIHGNPLDNRSTLVFILPGLSGTTLTVNSTADTANPTDPYLSLREAIALVNSPSLPTGLSPQILGQISGPLHAHGSDVIVFDTTQVRTPIRLGGTQLELSLPGNKARVTIDGGSGVTVDANNASRVFQVDRRVWARLDHLVITHGRVTLSNGGGILAAGTLTVSNSTLSANSADYGGGMYKTDGTLTVTNCTLSANSASYFGGGIYNASGMLTVSNSTLSANFAALSGGGILNYGTLAVTNSILSSNSADYGGGIWNVGTLTVSNSTLSSNRAYHTPDQAGLGGGIFNSGTATVSNCTITANFGDNGGGGIFAERGVLLLQNTIVAGNSGGFPLGDIHRLDAGSVSSTSSYNLVGIGSIGLGISDGVNGNQIGTSTRPIDPRLAPLGNYGGPTRTFALLAGSPALNAGDPALLGTADQRGVARSGGVNIGAYQASASAFALTAPATVTAGVPLDLTVSAVDVFQQPAVGYTGTAHLSSSDGQATLPADYPFTLADGGSHTFRGAVTLKTAGTQAVTATDTGTGSLTGSATVAVTPAAADRLLLSVLGSASAGVPFDLVVTVQDAYGNTVTGYAGTVTFATDDPDGAVPADYTFTADDAGTHTFTGGVTLFADGSRVTARDTQVDSLTGSIVVPLV
jgi:hypothetical protein